MHLGRVGPPGGEVRGADTAGDDGEVTGFGGDGELMASDASDSGRFGEVELGRDVVDHDRVAFSGSGGELEELALQASGHARLAAVAGGDGEGPISGFEEVPKGDGFGPVADVRDVERFEGGVVQHTCR